MQNQITELIGPQGWLRTRRNHALEHATIQVLSARHPELRMAGNSNARGFWIIGNVDIETFQAGLSEALQRLRAGEHDLAIHPNCGTNYASMGLLAGLVAWLAMLGTRGNWRQRLERLPLVTFLVTLVLILAAPLGPWLQRTLTTDADLGDLQIEQVDCFERNGWMIYHVRTR
ncbi:DUF6391 domain-containing protein [uncultured Thermanaerothrix sp.]|uniref:DUF6391 domain-containing protein n=1 Tax=uncultured Thermanaerothrix sp. TaxID=1195149 RepID=UPI002612117B|nr:DUF6391 domain-containing protein [uncultured Thermanaerothrix sp.]